METPVADKPKEVWRIRMGDGTPVPHARLEVFAVNPDGSRGELILAQTADETGSFGVVELPNPPTDK
jgi:hypothetical protein